IPGEPAPLGLDALGSPGGIRGPDPVQRGLLADDAAPPAVAPATVEDSRQEGGPCRRGPGSGACPAVLPSRGQDDRMDPPSTGGRNSWRLAQRDRMESLDGLRRGAAGTDRMVCDGGGGGRNGCALDGEVPTRSGAVDR